MKHTYSEVERMTWHERHNAYCRDEQNLVPNPRRRVPGLSVAAQSALVNNWKAAIYDWMDKLPRN